MKKEEWFISVCIVDEAAGFVIDSATVTDLSGIGSAWSTLVRKFTDELIFSANNQKCSVENASGSKFNPYSQRDVGALLRGALTEGDWKIDY